MFNIIQKIKWETKVQPTAKGNAKNVEKHPKKTAKY